MKYTRELNKIRYFGFKFKCPLCNSNLRKLFPFGYNFSVLQEKKVIGGGYRLNVICPVCNSTDRERLVYLYLKHKTNIFLKEVKVLHVAPEMELCRIIKIHNNIDYLTTDISGINVMKKMDITNIDFPDETFDVIICNHVLEHIEDDGKAMTELHRVLKNEGWGILQVPISGILEKTYEDFTVTSPSDREIKFGQSDHVRIYALDYKSRLESHGFTVNKFNWENENIFNVGSNKFGLLPSENLFVVTKNCSIENL
ncbi:class I SAM-dependent methyltransferase [Candidatus Electrothrix sp.]|uniref:class I SAM-dependent methyltransferase n=1 Tax=Candidatus Electrothrix sp. TaxID=2170559 RepID=UPI00405785A9